MYIAIDPGASEKKTGLSGYAKFADDGAIIDYEYLAEDELKQQFLNDIHSSPLAVICEDWRLNPKSIHVFTWSRMPTPKLIGWIEGVCEGFGVKFILQGAQIKNTGYLHWGKKPLPKSNPMNHAYDAVVHGREYLIKQGVLKA